MFTLRMIAVLLYTRIQPGLNSRCPIWSEEGETFYYNGMCHNLVPTDMSWGEARDFCAKSGWRLARTDDAFVRKLTENNYGSIYVWVGATDQVNEGDWRWLDGSPVDTDQWETDFLNFFAKYQKDCALLRPSVFSNSLYITPDFCYFDYHFICQQDALLPLPEKPMEKTSNALLPPSEKPMENTCNALLPPLEKPIENTFDALLPPLEKPIENTFAFVKTFPVMHYILTAKPDFVTRAPMKTMCCRICVEKLSHCAFVNYNKQMSKCLGYSSDDVLQTKEKTDEPWVIMQRVIV